MDTNYALELTQTQNLPLDLNAAAVYLSGLAPTGRRTQQQALDYIAGLLTGNADCLACKWSGLRYQHTAAIRSKLIEVYKPATANKMLSAIRGVVKQAYLLNQMSADDYIKVRMIKNVENTTLPSGRDLSSGELSGLMKVCEIDTSLAGTRDSAIIAVMYTAGLSRREVVSLNVKDYNQKTGKLKILNSKGKKDRIVYIVNGALRAVNDWLTLRGELDTEALFTPINKSGVIIAHRMSDQSIYNMLVKRGDQASLDTFSPHDLRRSFVSDMLSAGADVSIVSKIAGHSSTDTTARYDRRPEEAKKAAAGLLHIPYKGKK
jgi:site-specific recombinase XerD